MSLERLDKLLAQQGVLSRSEVKKAILRGRVAVNGAVEKSYSRKINTDTDTVTLDNNEISFEKYICGFIDRPSALWHQMHRNGQPLKNTVVRMPGPST